MGMSKIILKVGEKVDILNEVNFENDRQEEYLQKLIEKEPELIFADLWDGAKVLQTEFEAYGKKIDLLLCDKKGKIIIVELKRGRAPRDAIAQLLEYASLLSSLDVDEFLAKLGYSERDRFFHEFYPESEMEEEEWGSVSSEFWRNIERTLRKPILMLVSYTIPDEIKSVAEWLRRECKLQIGCVEFSYYRKEDKEIFVPVPIGFDELAESEERIKEWTPTQKLYHEFFSYLIEKFKERKPGITRRKAGADQWLSIPVGYDHIHFEWELKGRRDEKVLYICLDFEFPEKEKNEALLREFQRRNIEDRIREVLHEQVEFRNVANKSDRWKRIAIKRHAGRLEDAVKNEELKEWAVVTMVKFYDTLKPILDEIMSQDIENEL